ncbi:MAG: bifunctional phosphopantothenoylcysteine decarboxylase/phosphopantothenate--cysteine ligase CoaBC [Verrucomicrobiota bacterium]|nr:bifunctional phosphopantothenoylcysteine decarboxylase/phosphopantothenate--cysteine ligase CoaBC [Verrucomicrobiota bacterium]
MTAGRFRIGDEPLRILVTAGPTREPIDPVRFISNRSSGKMGYALAEEAAARGHAVCLVSGPVSLAAPAGVTVVRVTTAEEMRRAVAARLGRSDVLIMAAAVADWRPRKPSAWKLKKAGMRMVLELERTPDILRSIRTRKGRRLHIGFAAETRDMLAEARRKLRNKGLDLIVANDVSRSDAGFEVDTNRVTLLWADGARQALPLMSKREAAGRIMDWVERLAGPKTSK